MQGAWLVPASLLSREMRHRIPESNPAVSEVACHAYQGGRFSGMSVARSPVWTAGRNSQGLRIPLGAWERSVLRIRGLHRPCQVVVGCLPGQCDDQGNRAPLARMSTCLGSRLPHIVDSRVNSERRCCSCCSMLSLATSKSSIYA